MIWPRTFEQRLRHWHDLREQAHALPVDQALALIDQWWSRTPWTAYYLHWDDQADWPDPWQLLYDNVFCDVARALGIMYTIVLMDRQDFPDFCLVQTDHMNLVRDAQAKYILNCADTEYVNTTYCQQAPARQLTQQQIAQKLQ